MGNPREELRTRLLSVISGVEDYRQVPDEIIRHLRNTLGTRLYLLDESTKLVKSISPDIVLHGLGDEPGELVTKLERLVSKINELVRFEPMDYKNQVPSAALDNILTALVDAYKDVQSVLIPLTSLHLTFGYEDAATEKFNQISEMQHDALFLVDEIRKARESARNAIADTGALVYAGIFGEEAESYNSAGKKWLAWGIVASVVGGIGMVGLVLADPLRGLDLLNVVRWSALKIVLISLLYVWIVTCLRNYAACKHNAVLNRHRACGMKTFETFSAAAGKSEETKNAILLAATHSIFSTQGTGFLRKDGESIATKPVMEVIGSKVVK